MKSTYSISPNIPQLGLDSAAIQREGFDLIDVKFNDGVLFGAYGKNIGKPNTFVNETIWSGQPTFNGLIQETNNLKAEGYELTDVEYIEDTTDDGYWLGIFDNNSLESELITASTPADFARQVEGLQAEDANSVLGYQVVDIEYADGLLIGVVDRDSADADYAFSRNFSEFRQEVQLQREEGLELTNLEYTDGSWTAVFSDELSGLSIHSPQSYVDRADFETEITEFQSQGFDLINVESIEGEWFGIYKENTDGTDDIITPSDREAIADPVQNTLNTTTRDILLDEAFSF